MNGWIWLRFPGRMAKVSTGFSALNFLFELSLHSLCPFKVFVTSAFLLGNLDPWDTTCKYISKFVS